MSTDISVVVPVFNPGEYMQPLLDSLDRQTLPHHQFEAIFVDDGSSDGTSEVLDSWTTKRPHTRVIHQPNHGWPGQPRNVGINAARGRYVYFVDQDDWLADEALARLVAYGDEHHSDVIIGKMKGIERKVPVALFKRSTPRATIGTTPLLDSLTPHKVFRRAFLDEIDLRFPEGKRRLEDHLFVTTAYLRAAVISVYSDLDCYIHISRPDGGNAAFRPFDPAEYYGNLEEVLDVVDRHLPDGPVKDRFLQRWLKIELLGRLRGRSVKQIPPDDQKAHFDAATAVLRDRIPVSAVRLLPVNLRLSAALARHTTARAFFRLDAALARTSAAATMAPGRQSVTVRLLAGLHTFNSDATLSDLLTRTLRAPHVQEVLADFGANPRLLPETVRCISVSGEESVLTRVDLSAEYGAERTIETDDIVHLVSPLGVHDAAVFSGKWATQRVRITLGRAARVARHGLAKMTRTIFGSDRVDGLRTRIGR